MFDFDNSFARLPERMFERQAPVPVPSPRLVAFNAALARELGGAAAGAGVGDGDGKYAAILAGNVLPPGAEPIALAYAGHQFGQFVPQLGDGRAILLGEVVDTLGRRRDIQLKGSGVTPFSRGGDGRAALGPVLREYLVSEAMHALGVPTTRALAAVTTGEPVFRDEPLPGAVITRVAASHIRIGTFQYFAARRDTEALRALRDHVIARHYPDLQASNEPEAALLEAVAEAQAALVARWMQVGFIHGVMNTDNTAISGETIDYGPCAFMDAYDPATVFSYIDRRGRYAFGNQPRIAQWNLARFAEALLPLVDAAPEAAVERLRPPVEAFMASFRRHWLAGMRAKLGLPGEEQGDAELVQDLLDAMQAGGLDYTLTFRRLCDAAEAEADDGAGGDAILPGLEPLSEWQRSWRARLAQDARSPARRAADMRAVNPAVIPRNHQVEAVLAAAVRDNDLGPFEALLEALRRPFDRELERSAYALPPAAPDPRYRTYCGT
jgi:serine/tyrosine/threonine adenylyltransferase